MTPLQFETLNFFVVSIILNVYLLIAIPSDLYSSSDLFSFFCIICHKDNTIIDVIDVTCE